MCAAAQTGGAVESRLMRMKGPSANRLLRALPAGEYSRVLAGAQPVALEAGQVLVQAGVEAATAYFPLGAIVSLGIAAAPDEGLEVALVGWEGMVGLPLLLGAGASSLNATVVKPGPALALGAADLRLLLSACPALRRQTDRYLLVTLALLARAALCTRHHQVEQRLARWLLMTQDRVLEGGFHATHEFLAGTLGVRRAGVTRAAANLQRRQLIAYHRGEVAVIDRPGLQEAACSCYAADRASDASLMRSRQPA